MLAFCFMRNYIYVIIMSTIVEYYRLTKCVKTVTRMVNYSIKH